MASRLLDEPLSRDRPDAMGPRLEARDYRSHLFRELTAYAGALRSAVASAALLDRPVAACPGWDVRDLTHHLVTVHAWVAHAVIRSGDDEPPTPRDEDLEAAFSASARMLVDVLAAPPDTACWTFSDDRTVGFWQRRQAHEHAIHRWDLQTALDLEASLDADLATDGIDEVVTMFWPRQIRLGRAEEPADQVRLHTPSGGAWAIGRLEATTPCAEVSGTAEDLGLALWGRIGWEDRSLTWSGDRAAADAVLSRKLVP